MDLDFNALQNKAQELIQERGFMSGAQVAAELSQWWYESGNTKEIDIVKVIESIPDGNLFHSVEYANAATESFRRKDLFFYNPDLGKRREGRRGKRVPG